MIDTNQEWLSEVEQGILALAQVSQILTLFSVSGRNAASANNGFSIFFYKISWQHSKPYFYFVNPLSSFVNSLIIQALHYTPQTLHYTPQGLHYTPFTWRKAWFFHFTWGVLPPIFELKKGLIRVLIVILPPYYFIISKLYYGLKNYLILSER